MKTIGVMTSGGDAQGMNAAIYATVRYALQNGLEVYGIYEGYKGLIEGNVHKLDANSVENIIHAGGTILKTARCLEMKTDEGREKAVATLKKFGIEGLVVIGGDGSFTGAKILSTKYGIKVIGIPGTIDNDLAYTDFTLGFDTATNVVVNTINMLRDTMYCNARACVVEVMGRNCGDIAMYSALASGAEFVIVPEVPFNLDDICDKISHNMSVGKYDNIVVVAEGCGHADDFVKYIQNKIPGINIRGMVVGHIQRGGDATMQDRLLGIRMGARAVECLINGKTDRVIGIHDNKIFDQDILEALAKNNTFDWDTYNLVNDLVKY